MSRLSGGGLFSINGPPGTGKTTLLSDVIAAIVVERARLMAEFRTPADAFEDSRRSMAADEGFALDPRFRDFITVVASSNNGAVENITRELPDQAKVAPTRRADCSRFKETADALLNWRPEADDEDVDAEPVRPRKAWGLIAAALGKKANRRAFRAALQAKERVPLGEGDGVRQWRDAPSNIFRQLEELGRPDWFSATSALRGALADVQRLKEEIAGHERLSEEIAQTVARVAVARERRRGAESDAELARRDAEAAENDLAAAREILAATDRDVHLSRPGLVARFLAGLRLSEPAMASRLAHADAVCRRGEASSVTPGCGGPQARGCQKR